MQEFNKALKGGFGLQRNKDKIPLCRQYVLRLVFLESQETWDPSIFGG